MPHNLAFTLNHNIQIHIKLNLHASTYIFIKRAWSCFWSNSITFLILLFTMLSLSISNAQPKFEHYSKVISKIQGSQFLVM